MTNIEFLRSEVNGVEFFTLVATGESAVSERGLAKMSGVPKSTVIRWFSDLTHEGVPKWLNPLQDMALDLTHEIKKRGKEIKAIPADTAAKFISLVARNLKTDAAFDSLEAFVQIGLTSYIQGVTGWLPEQFQSSPTARQNLNRILDEPSPWVRLYEKSFCDRVFNWYGAQFYWQYAYFSLTDREVCKLNELNPAVNGDRDFRIHQYLESETKDRLRAYLVELTRMVDMAPDKQTFEAMYQHYFQRNTQLRLF